MASYNKFDNNVIRWVSASFSLWIVVRDSFCWSLFFSFFNFRDTIIITVGNCSTSFFAGFAIFSILGHMSWRKGVPVGEVADTGLVLLLIHVFIFSTYLWTFYHLTHKLLLPGPGLAFVAYPEALALLPGSVFWSIMFFLMLFMLGVDTLVRPQILGGINTLMFPLWIRFVASQFGNMEGITTAVLDEFPNLRRNSLHKTLFLGTLCFVFYLLGLLLVTDVSMVLMKVIMCKKSTQTHHAVCSQGGIYWFTLIDSFSTSFGLIIITLFMCLGISFFYGIPFHPNHHSLNFHFQKQY